MEDTLGAGLAWLCVALYWGWNGYWLTGDRLSGRSCGYAWLYGEIALLNLLHGAGWGYLLRGWGIL